MNNKKDYFTYTNLRKFDDFYIPGPIQNLIIRDYCQKKNLKFSLPVEEYIFEDCYIELEGILTDIKKSKGIIMCSYSIFPQSEKYVKHFCRSFFTNNRELHFILEKKVIKNKKELILLFSEIKLFKKIIKAANLNNKF